MKKRKLIKFGTEARKQAGRLRYGRLYRRRLACQSIGLSLLCLMLFGCASYRAEPLSDELAPADMDALRVEANSFSNAFLEPVVFDERDGLSLDEAAILAVLANPELRVARDRRGVASAQVLQAGILPNPKLSAGFEVPTGGNTDGRVNGYGLGLDWEVTALLARSAKRDAAQAQAGSIDLEIAWQEWQVAEAARLHCGNLMLTQKRAKLAQQSVELNQVFAAAMERGVKLGVRTQQEYAAAQIALQEAIKKQADAQSAVEQERQALNAVLGLAPETELSLSLEESLDFQGLEPTDELFEYAVSHRPDLRALHLGYESQEARVRAAVRSSFPKITLGLTGGRDTDNVRTLGAGIGIELPFFDRNQGTIALERATRKQLADEYQARLFQTRADLARIEESLRLVRQKQTLLNNLLPKLERQVGFLQKSVNAGEMDSFALYAAKNKLLAKKFQLLELEKSALEWGLAMELASGRYGIMEVKQ